MARVGSAIKIEGRRGRHELVNGVYEPVELEHNGKPCWVARSGQPVYLFHSGKSRWCVSKWMDDGTRCYAFKKDTGGDDPSAGPEPWTCCDTDGQWKPDPAVRCSAQPASHDMFSQLRAQVVLEMKTLGIWDPKDLKKMWRALDFNGNNIVSLAEIDKFVVEMVAGGSWPSWLNNKPALMRAYKKTIAFDSHSEWIKKDTFHGLLMNIFWFNKLWLTFDMIDTGDDRRIDANEFARGLSALGLRLNSQHEVMDLFNQIDVNRGGQVLFTEFCAYVRHRVTPDANENFDYDLVPGHKATATMRRTCGDAATSKHVVQRKCLADFDNLEKKIKTIIADQRKLHDLWERLDFNGNNIVSLAEIDKLVVEQYPLLNHKPALMRAYKTSMRSVSDDDWVQKKEFKTLLGNLFYFNKLFWLFEHGDKDMDRRLTINEFKWFLSVSGAKVSDREMQQEFNSIDRNHGGVVLFDEFCKWVVSKHCPQALTDLLN